MVEELFFQKVRQLSPVMQEHLPRFVSYYKEVIASKRRSSSIETFDELVTILIKRAALDPSDRTSWDELNSICKLCADRPFMVANSPIGPTISCLEPQVVNYLSSRISLSWRNFARGLNLPQNDIDRIESKCKENYSDCVKEVLSTYEHNMPWASESIGNAIDDVYKALTLLQKDYLLVEFSRLTGRKRR